MGARVQVFGGGHRLSGAGQFVVLANRFLEHLEVRPGWRVAVGVGAEAVAGEPRHR